MVIRSAVFGVGLLGIGAVAAADVAFDNLGSAYDTTSGWAVMGPNAVATFTQATRFTSLASGNITWLMVPLDHIQGTNTYYTFQLYSDAAGLPGANLGLIGQTMGNPWPQFPAPPAVPIASNGTIQVLAGSTYWIVARAPGDAQGSWDWNAQGQTGLRASQTANGPWIATTDTLAAMRLEVQVCYVNCSHDVGVVPCLNVNDFGCFLNHFAAGNMYANCDGSTTPPVLNINDFLCFLNRFAAGCSAC